MEEAAPPQERIVGGDGQACTLVPLTSDDGHQDIFATFLSTDDGVFQDLPCTLQSVNPPVWVAPNWFLYALWPLVKGRPMKPVMQLVKRAIMRANKDPEFAEALWSVWLASPPFGVLGNTPAHNALKHFLRKNL